MYPFTAKSIPTIALFPRSPSSLHDGFVASGTYAFNYTIMCTVRPATPRRKLGAQDISPPGRECWPDKEPAEGSAPV